MSNGCVAGHSQILKTGSVMTDRRPADAQTVRTPGVISCYDDVDKSAEQVGAGCRAYEEGSLMTENAQRNDPPTGDQAKRKAQATRSAVDNKEARPNRGADGSQQESLRTILTDRHNEAADARSEPELPANGHAQ
jgi:hypothetical protein